MLGGGQGLGFLMMLLDPQAHRGGLGHPAPWGAPELGSWGWWWY